ncbi:uncharacterized protein LOC106011014 [Aplysia californica]|uniref:Uncharacterized protein LOC106011014 n=1 Tax=Aplysia californica TaxID=6500 RepID=A0ABM0ZU79_APLCA|nr:uncharacterized protein LOC106011014 [Aplysia californica]
MAPEVVPKTAVIIPFEFRRQVFESVHNLARPGVKATVKLISEKFVWHGLRRQDDLGYSSAELVYGELLIVPGDPLPSEASAWSATDFLTAFRAKVQFTRPRPAIQHCDPVTYFQPSLLTAKYVYIRSTTVKSSHQRPYKGPYMVLAPGEKTFLLDIGGRTERISVDRLKPVQVDPAQPVHLQQPARCSRPPVLREPKPTLRNTDGREQVTEAVHHRQLMSRAGRHVRPPARYQ